MNEVQQIVWPYSIDRMFNGWRGFFRVGYGSDWSDQIPWQGVYVPDIDYPLYNLPPIGLNGVQVTKQNDRINVEFANHLANTPMELLLVNSSVEVTFDSGETWEPLPMTVERVTAGGE